MPARRIEGKINTTYDEAVGASAITPGKLVKLASTGKVAHQGTAKLRVPVAIALEDALLGKTLDDAYATDDLVKYQVYRPGDQFYGWIGASQTIAIGDMMEASTAGNFQKFTDGIVLCEALEAVTTGVGATSRILLRVA